MPSIRGTGLQTPGPASSYTISWPSGTVAGDFAVIFVGNGFGASQPSGWTQNDNSTGSGWNGATFSKTLTAADIATGSVVVTVGGTYNGAAAIATFIGGGVVKWITAQQNPTGSLSVTLTSSSAAASADALLYFGSNRASSTASVSRGTLQQYHNDGGSAPAAASGCLYSETGATGTITATFNYGSVGSGGANGNYQAIVDVGPPPVITASMIIAPVTNAGAGVRHQIVKAPSALSLAPSSITPVPVAQVIQGGVVNQPYSETITTSGGTAPYTYSIVGGSLPTGTSLNASTGVISGTPTVTGASTFTIKSIDALGYSGQQAFSITIGSLLVSNYGYVA